MNGMLRTGVQTFIFRSDWIVGGTVDRLIPGSINRGSEVSVTERQCLTWLVLQVLESEMPGESQGPAV